MFYYLSMSDINGSIDLRLQIPCCQMQDPEPFPMSDRFTFSPPPVRLPERTPIFRHCDEDIQYRCQHRKGDMPVAEHEALEATLSFVGCIITEQDMLDIMFGIIRQQLQVFPVKEMRKVVA
jgi:hypothetical protein